VRAETDMRIVVTIAPPIWNVVLTPVKWISQRCMKVM